MRTLARNKVSFYYALHEGKQELEDEYGNNLGEYEVLYGNPVKSSANISATRGETQTRQFGESESYDRIIVMDNTAPPIDEYSVLWVDSVPLLDGDGALVRDTRDRVVTPHDYVVKKVARSLNSVSIAIEKVNIS